MQLRHRFDIADLDIGRVHECIDALHTLVELKPPADIKRGARRCRYGHAADQLRLADSEVVGMHRQHRRCPPVRVDQLGRQPRLNPLGTQQRSCRQPRNYTLSARPQPRGPRPLHRRDLNTFRDVHAGILRQIEATQLTDG
jgi:hypothetical protein